MGSSFTSQTLVVTTEAGRLLPLVLAMLPPIRFLNQSIRMR